MKIKSNLLAKAGAAASALVLTSMNAFAQVKGSEVFDKMGSELKTTLIKGINVAEIAIILAGVAGLIVAYIKYTKEDRTSQDAMIKIAIGTAVAFAICTVFKLLLNSL